MERCEKNAYAKINLSLDVTGRLPNGYHEVRMIMQSVGIHDTLTFEKTTGEIRITAEGGDLPLGPDNLIYKAILLMKETHHIEGGVRVHLVKRIPIAAGMAGGSTDAACTLKAVNELYGLGVSRQELMELGVKIGADVPYCVMGGTALAEGIGEKLRELPDMPKAILVVAKPKAFVSTKEVYQRLDGMETKRHPDVDGMILAVEKGDLKGITGRLGNVLEAVTLEMVPVIGELKKIMLDGGALGSLMSGSGPTVFGVFDDPKKAEAVLAKIRREELAMQAFLTEPIGKMF